jgi:hypothetical protein
MDSKGSALNGGPARPKPQSGWQNESATIWELIDGKLHNV